MLGLVGAYTGQGFGQRSHVQLDEGGVSNLEVKLCQLIDCREMGKAAPKFKQRNLDDGVWRIVCMTDETEDWLRKAIDSVKFKGTKLCLVLADQHQVMNVKCKVFIPGNEKDSSDNEVILNRFKFQNQEFSFIGWKIVVNKMQHKNSGRFLIVSMPKESWHVLSLDEYKHYLSYTFTQVCFYPIRVSGGKHVGTGSKGRKLFCDSSNRVSEG